MFFIPYGTAEKTGRIRFPFVNILFVLVNLLVFGLQIMTLASGGEAALNRFISQLAFVPTSLNNNVFQLTILTSMFVHAGILHLLGNMLYLLPFGDNVEDRLGHLKYLVFYLLCGISATLIYALFNLDSSIPLVGASGAIAGVLGGYLALHPTGSDVKGILLIVIVFIRVQLPAFLFILYWFGIQVFSTVAVVGDSDVASQGGGVAFLAHVGGFVTGLVLAPLLANRNQLEAAHED